MPRFRSLRPLSEPSKRLSERESITELAPRDAQHAAPGPIFGRSPLLKTHSLRIPRRTRQRLTSHDFIESAPAQRSSPCPSRIRRGTSDKDLASLDGLAARARATMERGARNSVRCQGALDVPPSAP